MIRTLVTAITGLGLVIGAGTAIAKPPHHRAKPMMTNASVVERDTAGHATTVMVDGQQYKVCTAAVTDGCINPRQAGLNFGNTPLDSWPGRPASEMN